MQAQTLAPLVPTLKHPKAATDFRIFKGLLELEKSCPDLFVVMKGVTIVAVPDTPGMSAYVAKAKGGYKVGVNERWLHEFDFYSIAAVFEHELLHVVLDHLIDQEKFTDHRVANEAQDYVINDMAAFWKNKNKLNKEIQNVCWMENLNKKYNTNFNSKDNTSFEIYEFLMSKKEKEEANGGQFQFSSFDMGRDPSKDDADVEVDVNSLSDEAKEALEKIGQAMGFGKKPGEEKKDETKKEDKPEAQSGGNFDGEVVGQINEEIAGVVGGFLDKSELSKIIKVYGRQSADMRFYFENIEKMNKNNKIKNLIEMFFNSHKELFKRSFKKVNKRFNFIPYGRTSEKRQTALLAYDTSGSMLNKEDLKKMKMVLDSAVGNGFKLDIVFGDTRKLGEFKDVKPGFDFSKIFGGGGTVLDFIFKEPLKDYDVIVVVTDGCFDHDDIPKGLNSKVLFLITSSQWGNQTVPGFKNVMI